MSEALGRYVYCIIPSTGRVEWGAIGLDGQRVYAITHQAISALVHDCPTEPYQGDDVTVKDWVWTHGQVVDAAWAEAGSVLPMTFDCIIRPAEGHTPDETVAAWLQAEYDGFRADLASLAGKVELGVQVLWETEAIVAAFVAADGAVGQLQQEMQGKPKGMAYFYQQKIQKAIKAGLEAKADDDYRRYYRIITDGADDVHVNKARRPADGKQMLMNLSLLVDQGQVAAVGERLEAIEQDPGVEVRFTGPWPPYSFVAKPAVEEEKSGAAAPVR